MTRCAFVVIIRHSNLTHELVTFLEEKENNKYSLSPAVHKKWAVASRMRQFLNEQKMKIANHVE